MPAFQRKRPLRTYDSAVSGSGFSTNLITSSAPDASASCLYIAVGGRRAGRLDADGADRAVPGSHHCGLYRLVEGVGVADNLVGGERADDRLGCRRTSKAVASPMAAIESRGAGSTRSPSLAQPRQLVGDGARVRRAGHHGHAGGQGSEPVAGLLQQAPPAAGQIQQELRPCGT
jgi:hypothetical protein